MIRIGGRPHWHIVKTHSSHRVHDFVICCGEMGCVVKERVANDLLHITAFRHPGF